MFDKFNYYLNIEKEILKTLLDNYYLNIEKEILKTLLDKENEDSLIFVYEKSSILSRDKSFFRAIKNTWNN